MGAARKVKGRGGRGSGVDSAGIDGVGEMVRGGGRMSDIDIEIGEEEATSCFARPTDRGALGERVVLGRGRWGVEEATTIGVVMEKPLNMKRSSVYITFIVGAACALGGCKHGGVNYPEIPSATGTRQNPNSPASESAMIAALQFVANRYEPGTLRLDATTSKEAGQTITQLPMAVNLPAGMRKSFYERIARLVGPNVVPMTAETDAALPVYHVTRVWLRFKQGSVDVMRPMPELPPGPDGRPVYQTVTLKMRVGVDAWRVLHARAWEPGLDPVPETYYVPDEERIDQYNITVHGDGDYSRRFRAWEENVKGTGERRIELQENEATSPVEDFAEDK